MPVTGTVVYQSPAMVGHIPIYASGTAYTLSCTSGAFPTYKYKITSAKISFRLRNPAWETLQIYKGSTKIGSYDVNGTAGNRSANLSTAKELYTNSALEIKLYSGNGGTQLEGGSVIAVSVSWEQTDVPSSFDMPAEADAGTTVTATIDAAFASYNHKLTISRGSYTAAADVAASVGATSIDIPLAWCEALPAATSGEWTAKLATYEGTRLIGEKTRTLTVNVPATVRPSVNSVTLTNVSDFQGQLIQGVSGLQVATDAAGIYGSTITGITLTLGSQTAAGADATISRIRAGGDQTLIITATDSRGRTDTTTRAVQIVPYSVPSIERISQTRCDASGGDTGSKDHVRYQVAAKVAEVPGSVAHLKVERIRGSETVTEYDGDLPTAATISALVYDISAAYDLRYTISDSISSGVPIVRKLPTDYTYMRWAHGRKSYGFGMYPQHDNAFEMSAGTTFYHGETNVFDDIAGKADAAATEAALAEKADAADVATALEGKSDTDHTHAGLMTADERTKLTSLQSVSFGHTYKANASIATGSTTITQNITIPSGATVAAIGWSLAGSNALKVYCYNNAMVTTSVSGTTCTLSIVLRATASTTVNVHFYYAILK